jgi:hypothetical protein
MNEYGLRVGTPEVRSAGPITFGPAGILFLADNASAKVFAIDVADPGDEAGSDSFELANVDVHVGSFLGCEASDVLIQDVAVHPRSHNVYLSVQRGRGDTSQPVLVRIDHRDGAITDVPVENVPFSEVAIPHAPADDDPRVNFTLSVDAEGEEMRLRDGRTIHLTRRPLRTGTITDMAYVAGFLLVAGLSNEEFSSRLRRVPFPFDGEAADAGLEIYHVSHGKWETEAPIRTFVLYEGGRSILAGYTCTPVVHIPLAQLASGGGRIVGRTVAELGFGNQPLDMVSFVRDGGEHLLVANSSHGLVKIDCTDIDDQPPLTEPKESVGVPRTTEQVQGVIRLDNLGADHVLALRTDGSRRHLFSLKVDSL